MEILKYKKINNYEYEVALDNGSKLKLYDEIILKYGLLLNKDLDFKTLTLITKKNAGLDAYYLALKYLSKKMRSRLEIEHYLAQKQYPLKTINQTIIRLEDKGYLNEKQFIKSFINDQLTLTNHGPIKIKYQLVKLGVPEELIDINADFSEKLQYLINKKVKLNHKLNTNALKNNITNYLINLGYEKEMFTPYLDSISTNDQALIKKDYQLLVNKYQKKYPANKLNLFIKDKLYRKGYSAEEINEVIKCEEEY